MVPLERIRVLCEKIAGGGEGGETGEFDRTNAVTILLLAVGSLERGLSDQQLPRWTSERVRDDLQASRTALMRIDEANRFGTPTDWRQDVREASSFIRDAASMLLGEG